MIAAYLLNYTIKDDISFLAKYFDYNIPLYEDIYGTQKKPKDVSIDTIKQNCGFKAKFIYEIKEQIYNKLKEESPIFKIKFII